jgi:hypothetical protein
MTLKARPSVFLYIYEEIKCKVLGINRDVSFYQFLECRKPQLEKCNEFTARANREFSAYHVKMKKNIREE